MRSALILFSLVLFVFPATGARAQPAASAVVNLRPIDRATVRIISLSGIDAESVEGRRTRARRVVAQPLTTHGSGVVVGPRLILTARHVVWGANAWAVVLPGQSDPRPAVPVYVDPEQDIAFLAVDGTLPDQNRDACTGAPAHSLGAGQRERLSARSS